MGETAYEREMNRLRERIESETRYWSQINERIADETRHADQVAKGIHRDRARLAAMENSAGWFVYVMV
jgi:hypothetical protein